jgi:hypothetical protein
MLFVGIPSERARAPYTRTCRAVAASRSRIARSATAGFRAAIMSLLVRAEWGDPCACAPPVAGAYPAILYYGIIRVVLCTL